MSKKNSQTMVRVHKRENPYVQIDKTGLNDTQLSWKAKGLLCYLLSLPDDWQIYLNELKNHSSDGRDSTASAINELIKYGYCSREVNRDSRGRLKGYIYQIYEIPFSETLEYTEDSPKTDFPYTDEPKLVKPKSDNPKTDNPSLLINNNTNKLLTLNNNNNNQSINHIKPEDEIDEIEKYKKIISSNIEYDYLKEKYKYKSVVDDILNIMIDVVSSTKDSIRVNGEDKPASIVKSIFLKLDQFHIEYVIDCLDKTTTKASNIRAYLITTLYNSPSTINSYYSNMVQHDMYGSR